MKRLLVRLALYGVCFVISMSCIPSHAAAQQLTFTSPTLVMQFASPEDGMGLMQLHESTFGAHFLADLPKDAQPLIWKLELTNDVHKEEAFFTVDNNSPAVRKYFSRQGKQLLLHWDGVKLPDEKGSADVTVTIADSAFHQMSEWRIGVKYHFEKAKLWRVVFPAFELGVIGDSPLNDYLLTSTSDGRAINNPLGAKGGTYVSTDITTSNEKEVIHGADFGIGAARPYGLPYPSGRMQMQFCAYYEKQNDFYYPDKKPNGALYFAAHDPKAYPKVFFFTQNNAHHSLLFELGNYPDKAETLEGNYQLPYPVILGGYRGDWFDAAALYRQWSLTAPWVKKGPLAKRSDIPQWLLDINAVHRGDVHAADNNLNLTWAETYRKVLSGGMMDQWYEWSAKEKSKGYQQFAFPPDSIAPEGFAEIVKKMQDQQIYAFPYLNTGLWSTDDANFDLVKKDVIIAADGKSHPMENSKTGRATETINVFSKSYEDYLAKVAREVVQKYHVKGLYLDQGGAVHFGGNWGLSGDFNPNSPYPHGVTLALVQAEQRRFAAIAKSAHSVDPEVVLTGESVAEPFIDTFANRLIHFEIWPGYVPIFETVYHDYTTSYGRTVLLKPKNPGDPMPAFQIGWQLTIGVQIGRLWTGLNLDDPVTRKYADYLARATQVKTQLPQYINYGQMLRPPTPQNPVPLVYTQEFSRMNHVSSLPALLSSVWKAEDGSCLLLVTNVSGAPQQNTLTISSKNLQMQKPPSQITPVFPAKGAMISVKGEEIIVPVDVKPLGIQAYLIR